MCTGTQLGVCLHPKNAGARRRGETAGNTEYLKLLGKLPIFSASPAVEKYGPKPLSAKMDLLFFKELPIHFFRRNHLCRILGSESGDFFGNTKTRRNVER